MKGHHNLFMNNFQRYWDSEKATPWHELRTANTCQVQHPYVNRGTKTKEMLLAVSVHPSILKGLSTGLGALSPLEKQDPCSEEQMQSSPACWPDVLGWQSSGHLTNTPEPFCSPAAMCSKVSQALKLHLVFILLVSSPVKPSFFNQPVVSLHSPTDQGTSRPVKVSFQWVSADQVPFRISRILAIWSVRLCSFGSKLFYSPISIIQGLSMLRTSNIYFFNKWGERLYLPQNYSAKGSLLTQNSV